MKLLIKLITIIAFFFYSLFTSSQINEIPKYKTTNLKLYKEIVKMDSIYFTAYNNCDMKTQALLFDDKIEFYHDRGGLLTDKAELLKALEENICNKVRRDLIKGSVEVYQIPNYGAIQIGYHKFFNKEEPKAKSIPSKFVVIWKKKNKKWTITKVVSLH